MKISRGRVSFYDSSGNKVADRQYGTDYKLMWMIHYRTLGLKRKGKIVSYIQINPYSNPDKVRENGRNSYQ